MSIDIIIEEKFTLYEGRFNSATIYYKVKYNNSSYRPTIIMFNKEKLDILLRNRNKISFSEFNTYKKLCIIGSTTFDDPNFEPQFKSKVHSIMK